MNILPYPSIEIQIYKNDRYHVIDTGLQKGDYDRNVFPGDFSGKSWPDVFLTNARVSSNVRG